MKKRRVAIAVLIMCFLFSSCGGSGQTVGQTSGQSPETDSGEEIEWTLERIALPDPEKSLEGTLPSDEDRSVMYMGFGGQTIYRYIEQYDGQGNGTAYFIQKLDAPYNEWETEVISLEEEQKVPPHFRRLMMLTEDGELRFLYAAEGECYLERISSEGYSRKLIEAEDMARLLERADNWYIWNGENYIRTLDGLYCCQEDFSNLKKISDNKSMLIRQIAENVSGKDLYLWGFSEKGTSSCLWRYDETDPVIEEEFVSADYLVFYSDTEGYLCDAKRIWQFDVEAGSIEEAETYQEWGYSVEHVYDVSVGTDEAFLILAQEKADGDGTGEYILLKRREKEATDKIRLELATSVASTFLKESIAIFNRENEEYEIILRERPWDAEPGDAALQEYEDYCTRIQAEISAGNGPALIDTGILSVENGAAKGYLRDLTEDFEETREQCAESIWQNGMVDGKLYSVPYSFTIETFIIPASTADGKTSWTLEELMQLTRDSGRTVFGEYMKPIDLFLALGIRTEGNSELIDWENKISYLNGPEAMRLLEFSVEYGSEKNYWEAYSEALSRGETLEGEDPILRGEALTSGLSYIYGLSFLQQWETRFRLCDSEPVFIGFPSGDGVAGHVMEVSDFGVNRFCKHPEGAIAFLQFMQSRERQDRIAEDMEELFCYPVRRDSLETLFDKAIRGEYEFPILTQEIMGEEIETEPVSPETLEKFMEVIETAKPLSRRAIALYSIVDEELAPYFAGDKSAQEALDILQSRVQLYLNEMDY